MKRSWVLKALELLLWFAVAVGTAFVLVSLSEEILPANF